MKKFNLYSAPLQQSALTYRYCQQEITLILQSEQLVHPPKRASLARPQKGTAIPSLFPSAGSAVSYVEDFIISTHHMAQPLLKSLHIICYINNFVSYVALCQQLPPEMQFSWASIKIFMPLTIKNPYHTSISYHQISEMGAEGLAEALYQAFYTRLTASERKSFVTVDAIHEALKSRSLSELNLQNATLNKECSLLRQNNAELQAAQKELSDQCAALNSKLEKSEATDYEALLSDALAEIDKMKKCMVLLTDRLCAHPREPLSTDGLEECAEINDLALTLRTFQAMFLS